MIEKYLVIPANINLPVYFVAVEGESTFDFNNVVHREIHCDCYEHVRIHNYLNCSFLVDECGKINYPPKPVNLRASFFYPGSFFGDPLVGDVFVCDIGLKNGESDFVPLSEDKEKLLIDFLKKFYLDFIK